MHPIQSNSNVSGSVKKQGK